MLKRIDPPALAEPMPAMCEGVTCVVITRYLLQINYQWDKTSSAASAKLAATGAPAVWSRALS